MDLSVLGREYPPFEFPIERGKIREFANALEDDNPIYRDPAYAKASPFAGIIAPPTFLRTFFYENPASVRDLKVKDWRFILHGEQEFEYYLPIRAGDLLTGQDRIVKVFEKEGRRGGKLTFAVIETTFHNQRGEKVQVARRTLIETGQTVAAESAAPQKVEVRKRRETPPRPPTREVSRPRVLYLEDVSPGDAPPPLVMGPLTRTQIVKYAGTSGDFNPIHHDEVHAQRAGHPSIFAMGMLAGGYCARLLTDWLGDGVLRRLRLRFVARAWPDDLLTCRAQVTRKEEGRVEVSFECERDGEEKVITGEATAVLPSRSK